MTGKFIQLAQLQTFLTKVKEWATATFVDLTSYNAWKDTIKDIATTGAAEDVSIEDAGGYFDATDVEGALQEVGADLAAAETAAEVTLEVKSTPNTGYLKSYTIKQGGTSIGDIDIPKDFVVKSASTGTTVQADLDPNGKFYDVTSTGQTHDHPSYQVDDVWYSENYKVGDKYIDLEINVASGSATSSHVYINVNDLVDVYTAAPNASKIQLAIDANNVISASVVAGSIEKTDLVTAVQTSLGKADTALQESDIVLATDSDINGLFTSPVQEPEEPQGE